MNFTKVCTLKIVYPGDSCANGELCTGNSTCTNGKCACTPPKYVAMDEYSLKGLCVSGIWLIITLTFPKHKSK